MNQPNVLTENQKSLQAIRDEYAAKEVGDKISALISGEWGTGKTALLATGRLPLMLYSFDPKGTTVLHAMKETREQIEKGNILIRTYWDDPMGWEGGASPKKLRNEKPMAFENFLRDYKSDIDSGLINNFGTVAIDSLTTLVTAMNAHWAFVKDRPMKGQILAQSDYAFINTYLQAIIRRTAEHPVDFFMTAHLVRSEDEFSAGMPVMQLKAFKSLQVDIPLLFTEKYVLVRRGEGAPKLLTAPKGLYKASSQLAANGSLKVEEEPNIKNLLRKVGLPFDDKKPLF